MIHTLLTAGGPGGTGSGGGIAGFFSFVGDLATLLPTLAVGFILAILIVFAGRAISGNASDFTRRIGLSEAVLETPLGTPFRGTRSVEDFVELIIKSLFYVLALVVIVSSAGFQRLGQYGDALVRYGPSVIGGVLVVLVGFVIAGYVGKSIKTSPVIGGSDFAILGGETAKGIIYLISITLGLDAFGYSTAILNTLANAVVIGVGLGIAAAIGIGVGLGSQDYVADNIESWVEQTQDE
jgi:hypothetical protein